MPVSGATLEDAIKVEMSLAAKEGRNPEADEVKTKLKGNVNADRRSARVAKIEKKGKSK